MTEVLKQHVLDALSGLRLPGDDEDLAPAGRIAGLAIRDGRVGFAIETPPEHAGRAEGVRLEAQSRVENLPGVESATIVLTAHGIAPSGAAQRGDEAASAPDGGEERHRAPTAAARPAPPTPDDIPGVTHVIAVSSAKGGVGKSTVSLNLALALSALGRRVGLLDIDVYGPSLPTLLNMDARPDATDDKRIVPHEKLGLKVMSMGFIVDRDKAMIWRGPIVTSAINQLLHDVEWAPLDILVLDMPPGTGDAQLTIAQRVKLSGAVIVSTPQELALADVRRGISMYERMETPVLGVVENMAYFEDPAGARHFIFGEGGARRTAEAADAPFLGEIPIFPELRAASDAGKPLIAEAPDGPAVQCFAEIARRVDAALSSK